MTIDEIIDHLEYIGDSIIDGEYDEDSCVHDIRTAIRGLVNVRDRLSDLI